MGKKPFLRLDVALVLRSLAATRAQARDLIKRGKVLLDHEQCAKAGSHVRPGQSLALAPGTSSHVSRGALKLEAGLAAFGFSPEGLIALDVGASTGGFTEVLLARGAKRVYAVDVGHGQLHEQLRADPRVISLEGQDGRSLSEAVIPEPVAAIVADVSFISLTKVLPAVLACAAPGAWLVALVKPQFEAGREAVGKGGIVRDEKARRAAVARAAEFVAAEAGWRVLGVVPSPIEGGSGNQEFLLGARLDG